MASLSSNNSFARLIAILIIERGRWAACLNLTIVRALGSTTILGCSSSWHPVGVTGFSN